MGTTSNYSWPYPESTDPVADGATDIQALADAADTTGRAIQLATVQVFADASARNTALSGIEIEGMFAFLQDTDALTYWDGSAWQEFAGGFTADFLVIGGGGAGGTGDASVSYGGGGAGGYRNSYNSETSGGGAAAESAITVAKGIAYPIIVGAGGAAGTGGTQRSGSPGTFSQFAWIVSSGGGKGLVRADAQGVNGNGGSGGGGVGFLYAGVQSSGITGQGYAGGPGTSAGTRGGAGGGGAGAVGASITSNAGANGGNGVASTITGSSVTRGGGGGGGGYSTTGGTGGTGGGGNGGTGSSAAGNGTVNTGGGGGAGGGSGSSPNYANGGNGGSGFVVFRIPDSVTVTMSGGVTYTEDTVTDPGTNIVTVTATSTISETVTFS